MPDTFGSYAPTVADTPDRERTMLREAARLAADGELGNSDAIHLLQVPHTADDVALVLRTFEAQLSREAKSKLTLDALVPRPPGVDNQRFEPYFDKHIVSGATYTTRAGAVVPNELQYYNGLMLHLYGTCAYARQVDEAIAGSGYRSLRVSDGTGGEAALAQLWCSRFTDSSIGAYSAMFIVAVVVPDDAPADASSIRGDVDGAASVLAMLDGTFDPVTRLYENRARLFLVRLLDTTQLAIDVGRERMGTDKRPGSIDISASERGVRFSIRDGAGRGVAAGSVELAGDQAACVRAIDAAASRAGIAMRHYPPGTEFCYPAVARIGRGPVVAWQWRSDLHPRLQPVGRHAVAFDTSSEEGRMLAEWGFTPQVAAYFGHVRGVVTGLAGGRAARTMLPASAAGIVEVPAMRRLDAAGRSSAAGADARWPWETTYLGTLTATLRKEAVGVTPDGLRINWHVVSGSFVGPGFESTVLPGAADWMRIRPDGVGIVNVQACFETRSGARVFGSYGGHFDLGPDGYARALRDDYDTLPPVVVTPTYATADPQFAWLNRAQCVGVGRVDMHALRVQFDVYAVRVGDPSATASTEVQRDTLFARLGGYQVVDAMAGDFIAWIIADDRLGRLFGSGYTDARVKTIRQHVVDYLCQITGGPCHYTGRDMKTTHRGMGIDDADWDAAVELLEAALDKYRIAAAEQAEFMRIIGSMKGEIVEKGDGG